MSGMGEGGVHRKHMQAGHARRDRKLGRDEASIGRHKMGKEDMRGARETKNTERKTMNRDNIGSRAGGRGSEGKDEMKSDGERESGTERGGRNEDNRTRYGHRYANGGKKWAGKAQESGGWKGTQERPHK